MKSPFKEKKITINQSESDFLSNYEDDLEIPYLPHPGAFSKVRKNHIHEGIDLYCPEGENVYAMEQGKIVNILPFTGKLCSSDWWEDTQCIMIEGKSGVINYGEITVSNALKVGQEIDEGQFLGKVKTVLKKNKGRPMTMLHLELYENGTVNPIASWQLNTQKPECLKDPTLLMNQVLENFKKPKMK